MKTNTRPLLRWVLILLAIVVVAWGAKAMFFSASSAPQMATAPVTTGDVERTVLATGTLEAANLVSVGAQVSGQVKSLKVVLGQPVKKGDLIAQIDSVPQQNALRNAEANLTNIKAQKLAHDASLAQARLTFRRQKEMMAADATSRADYEAAEAALKTAEAQVAAYDAQIAQAQVQVETARVNLGYTQITAPIDGTVVAIVTLEGQTVNANQTTPTIVKLADLSSMTIKAQISEADVVKVKPGQEVYFTILGEPDNRYTASLRTVEPAPDSIKTESTSSASSSSSSTASAIYYNGRFDVPNPDGKLRISMTAQVSIVLARATGVPTIPSAALGPRRRGGTYMVQVLGADGQVTPREVKVGVNNNAMAEIVEGLKEGDEVVIGQAGMVSVPTAQQRPGMRRPPSPLGF